METKRDGWKAAVRRMVISVALVYAVICAGMFFLQRSLLYFPSHEPASGPLEPWVEDGQLIGYWNGIENPETVWLMMHGNAGQASDRDYVLDHLADSDALYVLEYPGYGAREGRPSRSAFDAAALDAYERLAQQYPGTPLGLIGESIGSGPASTLARAARPPDKIVLLVPFDTLVRVASRRFFFLPVWLLLRDRWDNIDALSHYRGPIDIYGAQQDEVIPCQHARRLAEHCTQAKYHELRCGHNEWSSSPKVKIGR